MGLDIRYHQFATPTDEPYDDNRYDELHKAFHIGFPKSFDGLIQDQVYRVHGETGCFRAGSYSGYGDFRRTLWSTVSDVPLEQMWREFEKHDHEPFALLCHCADNEGDIGPRAATRLAQEFQQQREKVRTQLVSLLDGDWYAGCYDEWQRCFETAAHTGIVIFG